MKSVGAIGRVAATTCFLITVWAQAAAEDRQISSTETGWSAIKTCAAILDDESRHACSDKVLRDAGLLPSAEPESSKHRKGFGLEHPTAPAPSPAKSSEQQMQQHNADRLEVTLAAVEERGDGKLVLTTTDGAIWQQVESDPIRPAPAQGQTMTIAKASLGGYLCKSGKWVAFRCFRTR
jgi:hypothetical protein